MGAADVVPGISGGTVALITGIYDRLVTAISRVDLTLMRLVKSGQIREAAIHLDLRFLVSLTIGLAAGFVIMTATMHHLLTKDVQTYSITLAVFTGMIAMSAVFLASDIGDWNGTTTTTAIIGIAVAATMAMADTPRSEGVEPSLAFIFVCGCIAICAMILPGISGAMILMLLGVYLHLSEIPHLLKAGHEIGHCLVTIAVFGSGCAVSLILFSKFLKWLLAQHHNVTMAAMCGFMVGALPKLWPFQRDLTPEVEKFKLKDFEHFMPSTFSEAVPALIAVVVGAGFVYAIDRVSRGGRKASAEDATLK
jgi:putative membrane protein